MTAIHVLTLPGWQSSGPWHWQSRWEALHGYTRVEQHDWITPKRGDWIARLEDVILSCAGPVALVAHSLGCLQVAAWAAHSKHVGRVKASFLVAPGDSERSQEIEHLRSWRPIVRTRLPFPSLLVSSQNDPFCSPERAEQLASDWGSQHWDLGPKGHINADSGLGDWPEGHRRFTDFWKA
jgi:predicted alpha/beta hydrolase family esterase